jgi:hypothetical protein
VPLICITHTKAWQLAPVSSSVRLLGGSLKLVGSRKQKRKALNSPLPEKISSYVCHGLVGVCEKIASVLCHLGSSLLRLLASVVRGKPGVAPCLSQKLLADVERKPVNGLMPSRKVMCECGTLGETIGKFEPLKVTLEGPALVHFSSLTPITAICFSHFHQFAQP